MIRATPQVSIIIPVHNDAPYLRECLDSVVRQTLREIEILCVDDASTDGSGAILDEYAARDGRIKLIRYPENRSASQARKDAVLASRGEYIQFLDADDALELSACEELVKRMRMHRVDLLQFGVRVLNADGLPAIDIEAMEKFLRPYPGRIEGPDVFTACFRDGKFGFTLCNKMYAGDFCRQAFRHVPDGFYPKAQDLFAFFILAFYARSYVGVSDLVLHHYRFGSGLTGRSTMAFDRFTVYCSEVHVAAGIRRFLEEQGAWDQHRPEYEKLRTGLLDNLIWHWRMQLPLPSRAQGLDLLMAGWGTADVLARLAVAGWLRPADTAQDVRGAESLRCHARPLRTLGVYAAGAAARLPAPVLPWTDLDCKTIMFVDGASNPAATGERRVVLPAAGRSNEDPFGVRARAWEQGLAEHGVDAVLYRVSAPPLLLWDLLAIKSRGVAFLAVVPESGAGGQEGNPILALADGVVLAQPAGAGSASPILRLQQQLDAALARDRQHRAAAETNRKALVRSRQREQALRQSWSLRIGRAILFVPGWLLGIWRRIRP